MTGAIIITVLSGLAGFVAVYGLYLGGKHYGRKAALARQAQQGTNRRR